jgi:peptidoglycan/xylan/chitin deacetylase (PgdA/CDA1 family)
MDQLSLRPSGNDMILKILLRTSLIFTSFILASCQTSELNKTTPENIDANIISRKNISFTEIKTKVKSNYDLSSRSSSKLIVNIALDGSENISVWQDTLDFAEGNNVKFTFFIVGVHLLQDSLANLYEPPGRQRGRSDVGFGGDKASVESRLNMLRRAYREGHEIAGHGNGHWDGSEFTYEDWISELTQFDYFFRNAYKINGIEDPDPQEWRIISESIVGFRAPLLENNKSMYKALKDLGYMYDTSSVLALNSKYQYHYNDVIIFPLNSLSTDLGKTISMDYNFFMLDRGRETGAGVRMLNEYRRYISQAVMEGNAPVHIGHHFARWNKGEYWWALKEFIREHCRDKFVSCVSFSERIKLEASHFFN